MKGMRADVGKILDAITGGAEGNADAIRPQLISHGVRLEAIETQTGLVATLTPKVNGHERRLTTIEGHCEDVRSVRRSIAVRVVSSVLISALGMLGALALAGWLGLFGNT